jgi:predicted ATPase
VRVLFPEIATEIRRSYDFLSITRPDEPSSVRAAFDTSWNRLGEREQRVLARLSVFRAGFDRQAAAAVAGASAVELAGLIDKSLVRALAEGRYDLHDLIAHFSRDTLAESGDAVTLTFHAEYFSPPYRKVEMDRSGPGAQGLSGSAEYADLETALSGRRGDPPHDPAALDATGLHQSRGIAGACIPWGQRAF